MPEHPAQMYLAQRNDAQAEAARLREVIRIARRGLLLAVIENDEFEWPDGTPDYHADGYAITAELGQTGDYVSARTLRGDQAVQQAIDEVSAVLTSRASSGKADQ